jgi:hypothetical protein
MWGDEMTIIKLKPLNPDSQRIDWLEKTHHVICFDDYWFCAWRGSTDNNGFWNWTNRPDSDTIRGAIDAAIKEVEGE